MSKTAGRPILPANCGCAPANGVRLKTLSSVARWIPTLFMLVVSLISYIDRNTLALLAPTILKESNLTAEQYGRIVTAFSLAYMIGNPVWGRLLDRFGLRAGMTVSVSMWTIASVLHAFAGGFWSFAAARCALGFGEGATFPGGLRTVVQSLPVESRSKGLAVAYSGGSLGAILTAFIITPIAAKWSWRGAFLFTGVIGACWIVLWMFVSRMIPPPAAAAEAAGERPGLADRRLWAFIAAYALGAMPLGFILYYTALYLGHVFGKTQIEIGHVLWIPPLGWELGYFFWGWLTDRTLAASRPKIASYRLLFRVVLVAGLPLAFATHIEHYGLFLFSLAFAMFVAAGFVIGSMSYAASVFPAGHSGFIAGVGAGSWSAAVGIVMPIAGRLFDRDQYQPAFVLTACFPIVGYFLWSWLAGHPGSRR